MTCGWVGGYKTDGCNAVGCRTSGCTIGRYKLVGVMLGDT